MHEPRRLFVHPSIATSIRILIVPYNIVLRWITRRRIRRTIYFHDLSVITHDKRDVVIKLALFVLVRSVVVNTSKGLVPWLVVTCRANHFKGHELGDETVQWIEFHNHRLRVTLPKKYKVVPCIYLATRDSGYRKTNIVEEFAPNPVTIKVNCIGKGMIVGSWCIVLRRRVTSNNDKSVLLIVDGATHHLVLGATRRNWE